MNWEIMLPLQFSGKIGWLLVSCSVVSDSLRPHGLYSPWNSPGQHTGVGSLSLLQGIFPTQESNPGLPHCRQILYQLSHKGGPRILEWVAYPFSSGTSQPRNWTGSPALQADSLPTELWGKPPEWILFVSKWLCRIHQGCLLNLKGFCVYVRDKAFNCRFNSLINTKLFKLF